jgi:hypothetical protein
VPDAGCRRSSSYATSWREFLGLIIARSAIVTLIFCGIPTAPVPNDAERWSVENWNGEQRNSLRLPTLFGAPCCRRQSLGEDIGLQAMQKIRPSSEDSTPYCCSSDYSTVSASTTETLTANQRNTDHSAACGSSAEDRHVIAGNSAADYRTVDTNWSGQ